MGRSFGVPGRSSSTSSDASRGRGGYEEDKLTGEAGGFSVASIGKNEGHGISPGVPGLVHNVPGPVSATKVPAATSGLCSGSPLQLFAAGFHVKALFLRFRSSVSSSQEFHLNEFFEGDGGRFCRLGVTGLFCVQASSLFMVTAEVIRYYLVLTSGT